MAVLCFNDGLRGGGGGSCRFPCSAGCVDANLIPVNTIAIVMDKVGNFVESLVHYNMLEGHGSEMGGDSGGGRV